jgi:L-cysteine desulfidase
MSHTLTKKQLKELDKIINQINEEAIKVIEDYVKNPSEMSGSMIQIHQNSPTIKE